MSLCAKINVKADVNGIVLGGDLYTLLKSFALDQEYQFKEIKGDYSLEKKHAYPVYAITGIARSLSQSPLLSSKTLQEKTQISKIVEDNSMQESSRSNNNGTIMLVDDNEDILLTYRSFLSGEGYKVEVFSDPNEALQHFAKLHNSYYSLVIMDIRMPYMNGIQLCNRLKAINKNVNVIFISALDAANELVSLIEGLKPEHVIKKPVNKENFMNIVKSNILNK
jgi:CheY-like chemotaxis protein